MRFRGDVGRRRRLTLAQSTASRTCAARASKSSVSVKIDVPGKTRSRVSRVSRLQPNAALGLEDHDGRAAPGAKGLTRRAAPAVLPA
jgi:hypothetical protein